MRLLVAALLVLPPLAAEAAPIHKGVSVADFFGKLEEAAKELAEGGMDLNRIRCSDDKTQCRAFYGSANSVVAKAPTVGAEMESITVTQEEPGESQDFWLTSALVMDQLDGDFKTVPERSQLILGAMRSPTGAEFTGNTGRYRFGWSDAGLPQLVVTAK